MPVDPTSWPVGAFHWRGDYDSAYQYQVFDCTGYSNSAFVCLVLPPIGTPPLTQPNINSPVSAPYWDRMSLGQPLIWQGLWSSSTAYFGNDIVSYLGGVYVGLQKSTNKIPSTNPLFWGLMIMGSSAGISINGGIVL
jgi:hypothetical protein